MATQKTVSKFLAYYYLKLHLHPFSKIKSYKEVTKQWESKFFLLFFLMIEGSGSAAGFGSLDSDPEPDSDSYLVLTDPDPSLGGPTDLDPDPDPQHFIK